MAISGFEALCTALCELVGHPTPPLGEDESGMRGMVYPVDGCEFQVFEMPGARPDCAFISVVMGKVPAEDELACWTGLLGTNFMMMDPHAASYSRNGETGEIILQQAWPLARTVPLDMYQALAAHAAGIRAWREDNAAAPREAAQAGAQDHFSGQPWA